MTDDELYQEGRTAGHRWAEVGAADIERAAELNKLASLRLRFPTEDRWKNYIKPMPMATSTVAEMIFEEMHRDLSLWEPGGETRAYAEFEESAFGANKIHVMNPFFVRGFADGALEKWAEIKRLPLGGPS